MKESEAELEKIAEILDYAIKNESVVSIFTNRNDPEKCCVGFVGCHDRGVIIKHITPMGLYDGFYWRRVDDIYRIDIDGKYESDIKKLYLLQGQKHDLLNYAETDSDSLAILLKYASQKQKIIDICIDESETQEEIVGNVFYDSTMDFLKINRIDNLKRNNGITFINMSDIVKCCVDAEDNR